MGHLDTIFIWDETSHGKNGVEDTDILFLGVVCMCSCNWNGAV